MEEAENRSLKLILLSLLTLLLINPVVLLLLSKNFILSSFIPIILLIIVPYTYFHTSKRKWVFIYLINFIALISIFLHAELTFRYVFPDYIIEDLYSIEDGFYFNKPELNQRFEDKEYNIQYRTNIEGYRIGESMNYDKTVEKCDWLFIGDSYTQGAQVEFENLFTSLLFYHFPNKVILNAGISGFGLPESYNYYIQKGKYLKPKKVFLQVCNFNDFMIVQQKQVFLLDYIMHYSDFCRSLFYNLKYKSPSELPLGRWTEPFYKEEKDNIDYNVFYKKRSARKEKDLSEFKNYLIKIHSEVAKNNAELIVFQIPTKEQLYYHYFNEVISGYKIDPRDLDMNFPNKFLKGLCEQYGIKYIDLQPQMELNQKQVFYDYDEHLNEEGHKITAAIISESIKKAEIPPNFDFISTNFFGDRYPSYINNSDSLLFQSFRHNNMELFLADNQFNLKRLTHNDVDEIHPTMSKDGRYILFTESGKNYNESKIVLLESTTGIRKYITKKKNEFGAIPSFSNNGKMITFARWWKAADQEMEYTNPEIIITDFEGNLLNVIADQTYENWRPVFSHNDTAMAYISKRNNNFDIYIKNILTQQESNLTNSYYDEWDPQFSHSGENLVYTSKINNNWALFIYNFKNKKIKQLTWTIGNNWDPSFSPDDQNIIFAGEYGFMNGLFKMKLQ